MATAKFKISDLTDNITSAQLIADPGDYDLIINDISGASAETKKIGLDTLKAGIFGTSSSPSGDITINGNLVVTNPDGPDNTINRPTAGLVEAYEIAVDVRDYTTVPVYNSPGVFPPGFGFSGDYSLTDGPGDGDPGYDTGMFWNGDDRLYLNTGNRPGLIVARRKKPAGRAGETGVRGELIENVNGYDSGGNHVGINIEDPSEKLHVVGNLRVDNDPTFDGGSFEDKTGVILAREFFVNVSDYINPPAPGANPGTTIPGYSFSQNVDGDTGSDTGDEGGNNTGIFWDGDDRMFLNANNKIGLVVATRERSTTPGTVRGPIIDPEASGIGAARNYVGVNVVNPRSTFHVQGDIRVDNNGSSVASSTEAGGIIMQKEDGGYVRITINAAGNGFDFEALSNVPSGRSGDAAYESAIDTLGVHYDASLDGTPF